ncbi:MAG TPA: hypothetical protein VE954_26885 [Oligoflexus sp.]|uniref:hypothetical protein n=1 Tax=Oligoflexus sp. TaxID=1971216 RepID=UPI002D638698|nr:hypothetical protein [Oligoflexus sp.]HYX36750.1 hypothetical protein [Oligoflexus sp.]
MRTFPFLVLGVLSLLWMSACSRFSKSFQDTGFQCGWDQRVHSDAYAFKILKPSGESLSESERAVTMARFLRNDGQANSLSLSSKGCVQVPSPDGVLQVHSLNLEMHASADVSALLQEGGRLHDLRLASNSKDFRAEIICPNEGFFGADTLPLLLQVSHSALDAFRFRVNASRSSDGKIIPLFQKKYGRNEALPAHLDVRDLDEGAYEISFTIESSEDGWDKEIPVTRSHCPLYVLRAPPGVQDAENRIIGEKSVLKPGQALPWRTTAPFQDLHYCREKRSSDEDHLPESSTCQASSRCLERNSFQSAHNAVAEDPGVYDYFLLARDRAGRESTPVCQRVIIAEKPPVLQVTWVPQRWRQAMPVMHEALEMIQATIDVQHAERRDSDLRRNLQCKVDLLVQGKSVLPGQDVVCRSTSCEGQTLDEYRRCDEVMNLDLKSFWKNQRADSYLLRLHVRAEDGAGQQDNAVQVVWIHPHRFQPAPANFEGLSPSVPGDLLDIVRFKDQILARSAQHLVKWDRSTRAWSYMGPQSGLSPLKMISTADGEVYGFGAAPIAGTTQRKVVIGRWNGTTWEIAAHYPDEATALCLSTQLTLDLQHRSLNVHPQEGFICSNSRKSVHFSKGAWKEMELSPCAIDFAMDLRDNYRRVYAVAHDGTEALLCRSRGIWQRRAGEEWKQIQLAESPPAQKIIFDEKHRLWVLQSKISGERVQAQLGFFENDAYHAVAIPAFNEAPDRFPQGPSLQLGYAGGLLFQDYVWNEDKKAFDPLPSRPLGLKPGDVQAFPLGGQQLLMRSHDNIHFWNAGTLELIPITWFNLKLDAQRWSQIIDDGSGTLWFAAQSPAEAHSRFYTYKKRAWNAFGTGENLVGPSQSSAVQSIWFDDPSGPIVAVSDRGLAKWSQNSWEFQPLAAQGQLQSIVRRTTGDFCYSDLRGVHCPALIDFPLLTTAGRPKGLQLATSPDDRNRVWIFEPESLNVWSFDGKKLESAPLPEAAAFIIEEGVRVVGGHVFARAQQGGTWLWDEELGIWQIADFASLKWPADIDMLVPVTAHKTLIQTMQGQLILNDRQNGNEEWLVTSVEPLFGMSYFSAHEIGEKDYVLVTVDGIYRGHGQDWRLILVRSEFSEIFPKRFNYYMNGSYLDQHRNLWLKLDEHNDRLLRLELNDPQNF